jgi:hypothetical protein
MNAAILILTRNIRFLDILVVFSGRFLLFAVADVTPAVLPIWTSCVPEVPMDLWRRAAVRAGEVYNRSLYSQKVQFFCILSTFAAVSHITVVDRRGRLKN